MALKIGINGFGRIGKLVFRAAISDGGFEVVGINDLMDPGMMAHMLKYDSTQGKFDGTVEAGADCIIVNGTKIPVCAERDPANLPWGRLGAEMILESTGLFATDEALQNLDCGMIHQKVTDHEDSVSPVGDLHELFGLAYSRRHRFLDEDVFP